MHTNVSRSRFSLKSDADRSYHLVLGPWSRTCLDREESKMYKCLVSSTSLSMKTLLLPSTYSGLSRRCYFELLLFIQVNFFLLDHVGLVGTKKQQIGFEFGLLLRSSPFSGRWRWCDLTRDTFTRSWKDGRLCFWYRLGAFQTAFLRCDRRCRRRRGGASRIRARGGRDVACSTMRLGTHCCSAISKG